MAGAHFNPEDSQLIADLLQISQNSPKLIRSNVYDAPSDPSIKVRSWKMNEFKYYDVPSPFPTLARGLFTRELDPETESDQPRYQIVARGYDKFFNVGEVPWTDWSSLEAHTGPSYTLSVKSNGCIIFISPISSSKLIVTSKHALGGMNGVTETHSQAGHRWLGIHLISKGKTEEELSAALWEKNWTAVAELCDDGFEEHVLAYPPEKSGLHLHGINENRKEFRTLPTEIIDAFAEEWGFFKTATIDFNSLSEVHKFTDEIAKTGKWNGEPLEGFVVRTRIVDQKPGSSHDKRPPYPSGSSFFFKVKFDEPYMMYRDWREVTKLLLSAKSSLDQAKLPRSKMKRSETQLYVKWVKNEIQTNPDAFKEYAKGKGIIASRERFLQWLATEQGKRNLGDIKDQDKSAKKFGKTIIVPVAIPGCGKTAVSVALANLFNFGHTQSDDVQGKKRASVFIRNVVSLLDNHDVVIADKNNHLRQHREELRNAVANMQPPVRLLALSWVIDQPPATVVRIVGDRIITRGDKHQSLRADIDGKSHEDIVWKFIHDTEELADDEVDASIEMIVDETLEEAVVRAVDGCVHHLGLKRPSEKRIKEAITAARSYEPAKKKGVMKNEKMKALRYYGTLLEVDIQVIIDSAMEEADDVAYDGRAFWHALVGKKRVASQPHITIAHAANLPGNLDLWERCTVLARMPNPPLFSFSLARLVWNGRVMAIAVEDFDLAEENQADPSQEKHEFISMFPEDVRDSLHITVGTANSSVLPYEAKDIIDSWRSGKRDGIGSLELDEISIKGRIKGFYV